MKRLGKGCSCCTVRGDILSKVRDIVEARSADQIVIQVPPRSDLEALSKTFSVADDQGRVLGNEAYVSRVVTVVDGGTVLNVARSSLADRLADLVGTAHAVWVDGAEGLGPEQLAEVVDVMGTMNPTADILQGNGADILLSKFQVEALSPPALEPLAADTPGGLQVGASCVLPTR
jgi:G3E family GTPase